MRLSVTRIRIARVLILMLARIALGAITRIVAGIAMLLRSGVVTRIELAVGVGARLRLITVRIGTVRMRRWRLRATHVLPIAVARGIWILRRPLIGGLLPVRSVSTVLPIGRRSLVLLANQPREFRKRVIRRLRGLWPRPPVCIIVAVSAIAIVVRHPATFFNRAGSTQPFIPAASFVDSPQRRTPQGHHPRANQRRLTRPHRISSGAPTPSKRRPEASTVMTAWTSARRATVNSSSSCLMKRK